MSTTGNAHFVWMKTPAGIQLAVRPTEPKYWGDVRTITVSDTRIPLTAVLSGKLLYECPTQIIADKEGKLFADSVFAILAGGCGKEFEGSRLNFRDVINEGKKQGKLVYVLPAGSVKPNEPLWEGYVRLGLMSWLRLPMPRPLSLYNRIPTRLLERQPVVQQARLGLKQMGIPVFNPEYFNKSNIYEALNTQGLGHYLPETQPDLTAVGLHRMLLRHTSVYLKPSGGSVGHGMFRISRQSPGYQVKMLKNGLTSSAEVRQPSRIWEFVQQKKVKGRYVVQAAVPLLTWQGRPCDFRVLLQKSSKEWMLVGRGVRVSGPNTITTHVPSGGSIANASRVLEASFGINADAVDNELTNMTVTCAKAIDSHYNHELGEMSMDIGIDEFGRPWFFEANAKPMKFDEPEIRARSLAGVLNYMQELAEPRIITPEE